MVDVRRYHDISEVDHAIINPLTLDQLLLLGDICRFRTGQRHLDLASGKGEMLCQYAQRHGTTGLGVDIHDGYVEAARDRAVEFGVADRVQFVCDDASTYAAAPNSFDIVSCIGATWIGGGLPGTLRLLRAPLRPDGWALVGEIFWIEQPSAEIEPRMDYGYSVTDLAGVLTRVEDAGFELVEMVLANHDTWDRHEASQWLNIARWLDTHPDDPEADELRRSRDATRAATAANGGR
jgi:cyclopropane fatty-acyl-phospholipid synthase-like methyltransferase